MHKTAPASSPCSSVSAEWIQQGASDELKLESGLKGFDCGLQGTLRLKIRGRRTCNSKQDRARSQQQRADFRSRRLPSAFLSAGLLLRSTSTPWYWVPSTLGRVEILGALTDWKGAKESFPNRARFVPICQRPRPLLPSGPCSSRENFLISSKRASLQVGQIGGD
jgi:hypothetical protein